jgi:hypothetical protein
LDNRASRRPPLTLLRAARIAVLVQALALLVVLGLTIPNYMDYLLHPLTCRPDQWCMDLRGLPFVLATSFLLPAALLLLATYWLWRRPRRWPAVLPLLVDVAVISTVIIDINAFIRTRSAEPNIVVQLLLGMLPAVVSLTLILALLRRWDSRKPMPDAVASIR